jgi:sugar/nucleoside kinase (ribokinase family)
VLDVGIPRPGQYLSQLEKLLPLVDVFLPNDDESEIILNEADSRQQAVRFHSMGAKTVVITCGEKGSVLVNDSEHLHADIFRMDYVDGSGSGDAFDAGYIAGMLRDLDDRGCLTMASALGASWVRQVGTTPGVFTKQECDDFLHHHQLAIESW